MGCSLEEMEERGRGGRERAAAVKDEVEIAVEIEALDGDCFQLLGTEFLLHSQL